MPAKFRPPIYGGSPEEVLLYCLRIFLVSSLQSARLPGEAERRERAGVECCVPVYAQDPVDEKLFEMSGFLTLPRSSTSWTRWSSFPRNRCGYR